MVVSLYKTRPLDAYKIVRRQYFLFFMAITVFSFLDMRTGSCFRELVGDSCRMRMEETNFSKRNCCCSSFGKAWGSPCEICPLTNSGMLAV